MELVISFCSSSWEGPEIVLSLDGKEVMRRNDSQHSGGSVGLRVVDTHAAFSDLTIQ